MNKKCTHFIIAYTTLSLSWIVFSCSGSGSTEPSNSPPVIQQINPSQNILDAGTTNSYRSDIILTCIATDADGDRLTYNWSATAVNTDGETVAPGRFSPNTTDNPVIWGILWAGTHTVTCLVSDGKATDSESTTIIVNPYPEIPPATLVAPPNGATVTIPVTFTFSKGRNVYGDFVSGNRFQISTSNATISTGGFSNVHIGFNTDASSFPLDPNFYSFNPETTYYWHVGNSTTGPWTDIWSFTVTRLSES